MFRFVYKIITENVECLPRTAVIATLRMKKKHTTSDLGRTWEIMRPLMYIFMFYIAISSGFRAAGNIEGMVGTYFIWLATGIVAWFYIKDFIAGGATCFIGNRALVCRTDFPLTALPMISVIANLRIHLITMGILIIMALLSGMMPSIYWLQLPVYLGLMIIFVYLWSFLTGLLNALSPDVLDFIKTINPAFFWLSGILFNVRGRHSILFLINPICYLVEGYRSAMCFEEWIWERTEATAYFAAVILLMLIMTWLLYRRLAKSLPEIL